MKKRSRSPGPPQPTSRGTKSDFRRGRPPVRKHEAQPQRRGEEREPEADSAPALKPATEAMVLKSFDSLWQTLFSSPVHLDSALSKLPRHLKTTLAQIVPQILLRPVSQAEALGIGVAPGEPWTLSADELSRWKPARSLAQRLHGMMSQRHSMPSPQPEDFPGRLISEWEEAWGRQTMLDLVSTLGRDAPLSLRASRKIGAQALLDGLTAGSRLPVKAEVSMLAPLGVRLSGYASVLGTDLYRLGAFEIQDEGSQVMALFALWPERFAPLLQDRPGPARAFRIELPEETPPWTVVDACAGAGGKSLAMSDALGGKGRVFAYDISATKLQALRRRAAHAGLNNIQAVELKEGEEEKAIARFRRRAHVVLVDAPCSGWGVLRRNPDIKWRQTPDALERMPGIQSRLLSLYSQLVAGEGRLIYGACTFRKEETTGVVERFLAEHPEFEARQGGFVGPGPSDGFFMQCFVRRGSGKAPK